VSTMGNKQGKDKEDKWNSDDEDYIEEVENWGQVEVVDHTPTCRDLTGEFKSFRRDNTKALRKNPRIDWIRRLVLSTLNQTGPAGMYAVCRYTCRYGLGM